MNLAFPVGERFRAIFIVLGLIIVFQLTACSSSDDGAESSSPKISALVVDTNSDGASDGSLIDSNQDGTYDGIDTNNDGVVDQSINGLAGVKIDLNNDGVFDSRDGVLVDSDKDGIVDGVDTNGDGVVDILIGKLAETVSPTVSFYKINVTVSGLEGTGLVLQNNGNDNLTVATNGSYSFSIKLVDAAVYNVLVLTQPSSPSQTCTVTKGTGKIVGADVGDITTNCTTRRFKVSATTTGLEGSGLTLQVNGGNNISVTTNNTQSFANDFIDLSTYNVTIATQPSLPTQACVVGNGSGAFAGADITNVTVNCTTKTFNVSANVIGNGSVTPTSGSVKDGLSTTLAITPDAGNLVYSISGCSGNLSGSSYTTSAITANCTVDVTFIRELSQAAIYSNAVNWNQYVYNDGASSLTATNTAFNGGSGGYKTVLHGGEHRKVAVTGMSSCGGLTANDELGVFDWACDASTNPVRMVTTSLKAGKYLSDLIDFGNGAWKQNRVSVYNGAALYGITPSTAWWSNPVVIDNNGSDGTDTAVGDIRLITVNASATYKITENQVALVVQPGVTLTGSSTDNEYIIDAPGPGQIYNLWIEGAINATNDYYGINLQAVEFSVIQNIDITAGALSFNAQFLKNSRLRQIHLSDGQQTMYMSGSNDNDMSNVVVANSQGSGFQLVTSERNTITNVESYNHGSTCFSVNSTSVYNRIHGVSISKCSTGFQISSSQYNSVSDIQVSNSSTALMLSSASNNVVSQATLTSNTIGINLSSSSNNNQIRFATIASSTFYGIDLVNGTGNYFDQINIFGYGTAGLTIEAAGDANTFRNIASTNGNVGIDLSIASNNSFLGDIVVGNNANVDCRVTVDGTTTNPGMDDDNTPSDVLTDGTHSGLCVPQGTYSSFTASTGNTQISTFVGKVTTDDTTNASDTLGAATFPVVPSQFDWVHFIRPLRSWGYNGTLMPSNGPWTSGNGNIWDWALKSSDTVARNRYTTVPTNGNNSIYHVWSGTPATNNDAGCHALIPGSIWASGVSACESALLNYAYEISGDGIGNDNGLCESVETCVYSPNLGSYQNHGSLINAGAFTNGTVSGVTLMKYGTSGY